ncbi:EF hand domain protein [Aspergillus saccharolyticus JOP 1030-1]|uniref:Actin cytoskeleton-regulatory complex protein END3 n=1 Tax=Aspergillus saccharolyticus JOP 1030-1 TaxID=1450539 RepID=A0A318ZTG9_9EURO|nr:UBA/TS-N domain protein [Aspergillus saccharolyticus JOP 1030-1]PYH49964.1 UBA/TS-N domain protein [Aspergillus saccharolyticus JOP 1030-1]
MADNARHPNLNLTPEEKRVFYQLFQAADTTNLGVITGEVAVPFFEKTQLAPETLGLIWQIADKENRGLLTPSGFGVVLRLIGHAQAGRAPTEELAYQPGPLPQFDGISVDAAPAPPTPREAGTTSPTPAAGGPIRVPPLNPEDVNKFLSLFEKSDVARAGVLSGDTAKQIFERARLPNEILGRIWNLADVRQQGALDATEFVIAMHLLTSYKSGAMRGIPQTLPPGLYDAASRRGSIRSSVGSRQGLDVPPVPAIPKQFTGPQRTQSPINRPFSSPLAAQSTGGDWMISPQEKAMFDNIFATVDTAKVGSVSGDQAVAFFMGAQLPEETLAQIWDLADIDADGRLTKDEFAVAMYLVRQQRTGKNPLPQTLPPALIPPSMRRPGSAHVAPPVAAPAQVPAPAPAPVPKSAADDLFGLDAFTAPAPPIAPSQRPQSTGGSNAAFQTPSSPGSRTSPPTASSTFKPFVPTSTFGQSLQPQMTGASAGAPPTIRSPPPPADDLLGDNDPEESKKLTQETTELANLSNQIGSLANEMQNVQSKRTSAERDLSQTSQQKRDFEARLAQARAMYEQEVKNFKALEERLNASRAETSKLQQEYALLEGSRQDLQNQYNQVSAALAADQQENANLKEKIREANAAVAQLKPALDKARSNARQQKGLVAINKKQLATVEGERDKIKEEIDTLSQEQSRAPEEGVAAASEAAAVMSPAESTMSQNTNPFFKRTPTGSSENNALSPQISNDQQRAFDSLFGTSFVSPTTAATPPPPVSFRAESQPTSGIPTPSVSLPPSVGTAAFEPPALSQSRQLTPNVLPFGEDHSVTSSTRVSPPGSRFGGFDTASEAAGPTPTEPTKSVPSPFDEIEEPKERFPELSDIADHTPASADSATSDENAGEKKDLSFDELFGGPAHKRSQSQKEHDFEEAFAAMKHGPGSNKTNGAAPVSQSEFPPIRELDDGDESSDSEAPMGFEDDFAPAFPPQSQIGGEPKPDALETPQLAAFPPPGAATTPSEPPAAEAQRSPPNYEDSVGKQEPGSVPPEFNGLLPSREDPTTAADAPHSVESSTGAPIIGGEPQRDTREEAKAAPQEAKPNAPDFEAAFAGLNLAPAKEAEDDEDDFETVENKDNMDFDFSFDNPTQKAPQNAATSSDFFDFNKNATASSPGFAATSPDTNAQAQTHNWEELFAPLDNANTSAGGANGSTNANDNAQAGKPPGWALQTGTEDDQILQRLTNMGFPREESLAALEKFDYNIDKVRYCLPQTSLLPVVLTRTLSLTQAVDHLTSKA